MAIKTDQQLKFIKKSFATVQAAVEASQVAGTIIFDQTHNLICVDGQSYGASSYQGEYNTVDGFFANILSDQVLVGQMFAVGAISGGLNIEANTVATWKTNHSSSGPFNSLTVPTGHYEQGDVFISTASGFVVLTGENQVVNNTTTTGWAASGNETTPLDEVSIPVGTVDGIQVDARVKNPAFVQKDIDVFNEFTIGNKTFAADTKVDAGTAIEDLLRQILTKVMWPSAPTLPALTLTATAVDMGCCIPGATWAGTNASASISKGRYDGSSWTGHKNDNTMTGVTRTITWATGTATGCFSGESKMATKTTPSAENSSAATHTDSNSWPSVTVKTLGDGTSGISVSGSYGASQGQPLKNNGEATNYQGLDANHKDQQGQASAKWAAGNLTAQTKSTTAKGVLPIFGNFTIASANQSSNTYAVAGEVVPKTSAAADTTLGNKPVIKVNAYTEAVKWDQPINLRSDTKTILIDLIAGDGALIALPKYGVISVAVWNNTDKAWVAWTLGTEFKKVQSNILYKNQTNAGLAVLKELNPAYDVYNIGPDAGSLKIVMAKTLSNSAPASA